MLAARDRSEEFKFDLPLYLIFAQICGPNLDLVPFEGSAFLSLDFRLVDWRILSWCDIPVDDEEAEPAVLEIAYRVENDNFGICRGSNLLCRDHDAACLSSRKLLVHKRLCHDLVASCDNLVEGKLVHSDVVVTVNLFGLVRTIIGIIHLNFELLFLLEMEVNQDFLDELWIQIVMDQLSLANLLPTVVQGPVKDNERVRLAESVHVGKLLTLEAQGKLLSEPLSAEVCSGKDSSVEVGARAHL